MLLRDIAVVLGKDPEGSIQDVGLIEGFCGSHYVLVFNHFLNF